MDEQELGIIETRSLAEQVYLYLSNSIIRGRYNYGQTINTKQLTSELKVSMMPIREALKRLELEGIVEVRPRSMCVITTPTRETIYSAIAVRELLETYCVKNAYNSVSLEQLKPLRTITEDMEKALSESTQGDLRSYIHHDWRFHKSLCGLLGNAFIDKSYRELNLHLNMYYMYDIGIKPNVSQTFRDHIDLLDAMERKDSRAVEIIERHLRVSRQNIMRGKLFTDTPETLQSPGMSPVS